MSWLYTWTWARVKTFSQRRRRRRPWADLLMVVFLRRSAARAFFRFLRAAAFCFAEVLRFRLAMLFPFGAREAPIAVGVGAHDRREDGARRGAEQGRPVGLAGTL